YNLSTYLGTAYIGDADVTFITGPSGPGNQAVWMTGFVDGVCDIGHDEVMKPGECTLGKVSYLGGHAYGTAVPLSANRDSQGTRLFLNALFEADCVTTAGQPRVTLALTATGGTVIDSGSLPVDAPFTLSFANAGSGAALDATLRVTAPPAGIALESTDGTVDGASITWDVGSIGPPGSSAPPAAGWRTLSARTPPAG